MAQICGTPGLDGPENISASLNSYFPPNGNITLAAGAKSISLAAVPANDVHGNNFGTEPILAGDLILIIQMQDATGKRAVHPIQYLAMAYGLLPEVGRRLVVPLKDRVSR